MSNFIRPIPVNDLQDWRNSPKLIKECKIGPCFRHKFARFNKIVTSEEINTILICRRCYELINICLSYYISPNGKSMIKKEMSVIQNKGPNQYSRLEIKEFFKKLLAHNSYYQKLNGSETRVDFGINSVSIGLEGFSESLT